MPLLLGHASLSRQDKKETHKEEESEEGKKKKIARTAIDTP